MVQTRIQNYCMSVVGSNIYENFCEIIADQDYGCFHDTILEID